MPSRPLLRFRGALSRSVRARIRASVAADGRRDPDGGYRRVDRALLRAADAKNQTECDIERGRVAGASVRGAATEAQPEELDVAVAPPGRRAAAPSRRTAPTSRLPSAAPATRCPSPVGASPGR